MTRFIFITGGVVSSLGKGLGAAALAALLQAHSAPGAAVRTQAHRAVRRLPAGGAEALAADARALARAAVGAAALRAVGARPAGVALARAGRRAAAVRRAVVRAERRRAVGAAPAGVAHAEASGEAAAVVGAARRALRERLARVARVERIALADARRHAAADAAAVARRGTEAVGEQGEFAILSAHHQVHIAVSINIADRWGALGAYVDDVERVQVVSHTIKIRRICRSIVHKIVDPAVASPHDQIEIAVAIEV